MMKLRREHRIWAGGGRNRIVANRKAFLPQTEPNPAGRRPIPAQTSVAASQLLPMGPPILFLAIDR